MWHYTVGAKIKSIEATGIINCADPLSTREKPAVWFSTNPIWENTVDKINRTVFALPTSIIDQHFKWGLKPIRIKADTNKIKLFSFKYHRKYGGISNKMYKRLIEVAKMVGANSKQWYVCYEPVELINCHMPIQVWDGTQWN